MATDSEIETCHTTYVKDLMNETEKMSLNQLKDISVRYDSMYFHNNSNKAARNFLKY